MDVRRWRNLRLVWMGTLGFVVSSCDYVRGDPVPPRGDEWVVVSLKQVSGAAGRCARPRVFYRDADGDGYGDPAQRKVACRPPPGYVEVAGDCYDRNPRVHPGQTEAFATDRGDGSFDYDCDGRETLRLPSRAFCRLKADESGCVLQSGWADRKVPKCGRPGHWTWYECVARLVAKSPQTVPIGPRAAGAGGGLGGSEVPSGGARPTLGQNGSSSGTRASGPSSSGGLSALPPPAVYRTVYECRGRKLQWLKRQLCR